MKSAPRMLTHPPLSKPSRPAPRYHYRYRHFRTYRDGKSRVATHRPHLVGTYRVETERVGPTIPCNTPHLVGTYRVESERLRPYNPLQHRLRFSFLQFVLSPPVGPVHAPAFSRSFPVCFVVPFPFCSLSFPNPLRLLSITPSFTFTSSPLPPLSLCPFCLKTRPRLKIVAVTLASGGLVRV